MDTSNMTKEIYKAKMQARLDDWSGRLQVLKARADQASADAKLELIKRAEELQGLETSAKKQLAEVEQVLSESWQKVKGGVETTWDQLSGSFEAAWAKIAPEKSGS